MKKRSSGVTVRQKSHEPNSDSASTITSGRRYSLMEVLPKKKGEKPWRTQALGSYRVPVMPSLDGNTVEMSTEQTAFAENAVAYSATLSFVQGKVNTITRALKGE